MYVLATWVHTLTPIHCQQSFGLPYLGVDIGRAVQPGLLPPTESSDLYGDLPLRFELGMLSALPFVAVSGAPQHCSDVCVESEQCRQ